MEQKFRTDAALSEINHEPKNSLISKW